MTTGVGAIGVTDAAGASTSPPVVLPSGLVRAWFWSPDGSLPVGDGVFADFNLLWNDVLASGQLGEILVYVCDASGGYSVLPIRTGGGAYDFEGRITLIADPGTYQFVQFADGATAENVGSVGTGVYLNAASETIAPITVTAGSPALRFWPGSGVYLEADQGPLINVVAGINLVELHDADWYTEGNEIVSIALGATLLLYLMGYSGSSDNAISGPVGSTLNLGIFADCYPPTTNTGFLGTQTTSFKPWTRNILHPVAVPGDWTGLPSNQPQASVAIDNLAATRVNKASYTANTVLAATVSGTPAAVTMAPSTFLARLAAGNIVAATVAQVLTLLGLSTSGRILQTVYKVLAADLATVSTANPPTAVLVTQSVVMAGASKLRVWASITAYMSVSGTLTVALYVNGVLVDRRGTFVTLAGDSHVTTLLGYVTGLAAGAVDVEVRWSVNTGTGSCNPVSSGGLRGATLLIDEVTN